MADESIRDLTQADADLCVRLAKRMELRHPLAKEDQLVIFALRYLATAVREGKA